MISHGHVPGELISANGDRQTPSKPIGTRSFDTQRMSW
jgi:hypothetical protein